MSSTQRGGVAPAGVAVTPKDEGDDASRDLLERCGWSFVWIGVLLTGLWSSNNWLNSPWEAWLAPLTIGVAIGGGTWIWAVRGEITTRARVVSIAAALLASFVPAAIDIHTRRYLATDSTTFNQLAAELLAHGHNPYGVTFTGAWRLLHPVSDYWTYLATGGHVTQVSYPAGSFLLVAPFVALGFHHAISDWVDLYAWAISAVLLIVMLPRRLGWLACALVLFAGFTGAFSGGGTDALFVPFLLLAVWRWDRYSRAGSPRIYSWLSPVALGMACAIKQSPWFVVPFLILGITLEHTRTGRSAVVPACRYLAIVGGVFALVNLPFIIVNPSSWLHSVVLPFFQPLIPDGAGVVGLALHGLTGGAVLPWLSAAGLMALLALLVAFVRWYPLLKRGWLFALPVVLFIPPRSLLSYLTDFIPAAIVAALCVEPAPPSSPRAPRSLGALALVATVACGAMVVVGLTIAPLRITVLGVGTSQEYQVLNHVALRVDNTSSKSVDPHFMVDLNGGHPDGFWRVRVVSGHLPLKPGATALVVITPPSFLWAPSFGSFWIVDAYSNSPNAISTSPLQQWRLRGL